MEKVKNGLEKYLGGAGRLFLLFSLGFCLLSVYTGQRDAFTGQALVVGVLLFCAAVFTTFPYVFLGSGTTNNQHLALLFEALAIYVFLRSGGFWRFPVSGALLAVGELMRPTAAVILLALTIAALAGGFVRRDRREMLGPWRCCLPRWRWGRGPTCCSGFRA